MIDQPTSIRQGETLDQAKLNDYLHQQLSEFGTITHIQQFPSGYSNLTYLLTTATGEYVLRRPPVGAKIKTAHDMGREFQVLSALKKPYGKVPTPILHCEDSSVIGAPFYLMERVKGIILRNKAPKNLDLTPSVMRQISTATVDNLLDLHSIDINQTGLIQLGKPQGYVERQVHGWIKRYYRAETDSIKEMDALAEWMKANIPPDTDQPTFIHNDYKYDNVVLNPDNLSDITAVLDWEMATVGDPLMDLATTLGYWAEKTDSPALQHFSLTALEGNLTRQEILERYVEKSGRNVANFVFYYAYACFKIGVICQQIYARFKKGLTKDPRFGGLIFLVHACGRNGWNAVRFNRISQFR